MLRCARWLALLCLAGGTAHAAETVQLALRASVVLDHPQVLLADVAVIKAPTPALQAALEQVQVGSAPRVANVEQLSREALGRIVARRFFLEQVDLQWSGAPTVQLRTASQMISVNVLVDNARAAVLAAFGARHPQLAVTALPGMSEVEVPAGALQVSARALAGAPLQARMPVWLDLAVGGVPYRSVLVPLQVSAPQRVYVALRALAQGAEPGAADFDLRTVDVAGVAGEPVAEAGLPRARRLRQAVAAGQVLTQQAWFGHDMVLRGDRVRLAVAAGPVRVETMAQAQGDAAIGEWVKVKPDSGKDWVAARVMAPGLVQVEGR